MTTGIRHRPPTTPGGWLLLIGVAAAAIAGCGAPPAPAPAEAPPNVQDQIRGPEVSLPTDQPTASSDLPAPPRPGLRPTSTRRGYTEVLPEEYFRPQDLSRTKAGMKQLVQQLAVEIELEEEEAARHRPATGSGGTP
ncbi:MAG: hypothetical protein GX442_08525 [Candidatus Riflebacteria bacterium]|nr:hypothetical protein [Candidatus Riflebacteria bacterium]